MIITKENVKNAVKLYFTEHRITNMMEYGNGRDGLDDISSIISDILEYLHIKVISHSADDWSDGKYIVSLSIYNIEKYEEIIKAWNGEERVTEYICNLLDLSDEIQSIDFPNEGMRVANYIVLTDYANHIVEKIKNHKSLDDKEIEYVSNVLSDPLQEFCNREGTFRLVEIFDISPEKANKLEDQASEIIRDCIDCSERLYDQMDDSLRELLTEEGE